MKVPTDLSGNQHSRRSISAHRSINSASGPSCSGDGAVRNGGGSQGRDRKDVAAIHCIVLPGTASDEGEREPTALEAFDKSPDVGRVAASASIGSATWRRRRRRGLVISSFSALGIGSVLLLGVRSGEVSPNTQPRRLAIARLDTFLVSNGLI